MKLKHPILLLLLSLMLFACSEDEKGSDNEPAVTTSEVSEITYTTAVCGGTLIVDGNNAITAKGIVWHTSANPTLETHTGKTTNGTAIEKYASNLADLTANTAYFVRAYATNAIGTGYGDEIEFMTNDLISMEMVNVNEGTFQMGSSSGNSNEKPIHSVTLSGYTIGKYEVTQAQWVKIMGNNPSHMKGDNLPVETVAWNDIQLFITKLNEQTNKKYRLPTEAEWEFAARGGNLSEGYIYSGSNSIGDIAEYAGNNDTSIKPVGGKQGNELGIYDMTGNVYELCNDNYELYGSASVTNPTGPSSGDKRSLRGGSCFDLKSECRITCRYQIPQTAKAHYIGFRLAHDL